MGAKGEEETRGAIGFVFPLSTHDLHWHPYGQTTQYKQTNIWHVVLRNIANVNEMANQLQPNIQLLNGRSED